MFKPSRLKICQRSTTKNIITTNITRTIRRITLTFNNKKMLWTKRLRIPSKWKRRILLRPHLRSKTRMNKKQRSKLKRKKLRNKSKRLPTLKKRLRITKKRSKKPKSNKKINNTMMPSLLNSMKSKESLTLKLKKKLLSTQSNLLRMSWPQNKNLKSMLSPRRLKMQLLLKRPPKKPRKQLRKRLKKRKRKRLKLKSRHLPSKRRRQFITKLNQLRLPILFKLRKSQLVQTLMKSLRKSKPRRKPKKKRKTRKQLLLSRTLQKKLLVLLKLPS